MGFLKKLFGTAAVVGAAAGSALYVKKRKDTRLSLIHIYVVAFPKVSDTIYNYF